MDVCSGDTSIEIVICGLVSQYYVWHDLSHSQNSIPQKASEGTQFHVLVIPCRQLVEICAQGVADSKVG